MKLTMLLHSLMEKKNDNTIIFIKFISLIPRLSYMYINVNKELISSNILLGEYLYIELGLQYQVFSNMSEF